MTPPRANLRLAPPLLLAGLALGCGAAPPGPATAGSTTSPGPTSAATTAATTAAALDPTTAVGKLELRRQACERGHAASCLTAAVLLDEQAAAGPPSAAPTTYDRAMSLRLTGCELGLRAACFSAAVQLRTARGIAPDEELAGRLTQLSCSDGLCGARFEDLVADHVAGRYTTLFASYLDDRIAVPAAALGIVELALIVSHRDVVATEPWTLTCTAERGGTPTRLSLEVPRSPLEYEAVQLWTALISVPTDAVLGECAMRYPNDVLRSSQVWVGVRGAPRR